MGCLCKPKAIRIAVYVALVLGAALRTTADDDETMTRYLEKLGLVDLEIVHLELVLDKPLPAERRVEVAKKLADLYAGKLLETGEDPQAEAGLMARTQSLLQRIPDANTPSLQVMLLQADYNEAENRVAKWLANPADTESRDQAAGILGRIAPQLNEYQRELNEQAAALNDEINQMAEGDAQDLKLDELRRLQPVLGRASYFAGWAAYYHGVIHPIDGQADFSLARQIFRDLLDITGDDYGQLDPEWLGLGSTWRARAMIGLGLAEAATGNLEASRTCFELLEDGSVPPEIQDQASYWFLRGLLNAGRFDEAVAYGKEKISRFSGQATRGKISLCVSLVRAGFADQSQQGSPAKRTLGTLGLEGLARLDQHRVIRSLIAQYEIDLSDHGGFFLRWIQGRQLLAHAEESKQSSDYRDAAEALTAALSSPEANSEVGAAAHCRYELAWCLYQLGEYEKAARDYEQAVTGLKVTDASMAVQSAWMAFAAYQKLSETQPRFSASAIAALTMIKRDFPNSPYSQKADYYLRKLKRGSTSPEQMLRELQQVQPGSPTYLSARYDICLVTHQLWAEAEAAQKVKYGRAVRDAVDAYLAAARTDDDDGRKLKCLLLAVDVALNGQPADTALSASYLNQAEPLAAAQPPSSPLAAEFHYRRLQLASQTGDIEGRHRHADWLIENAAGSAYEIPALIVAAKAVDATIANAAETVPASIYQDGFTLYSRLADRLGSSPETLRSQKNARVANSKASYYAFQTGQFNESAWRLERLLAAMPNNRSYLSRAAKAQYQAGAYDRSLPHWRTLLAGLPAGSTEWYEAKYYQVKCLQQTDPGMAAKVLEQFRLLHPDLGPQPWREKFQSLLSGSGD